MPITGAETGTAIPAIGADRKAEPDARPLRRSRTAARRGRPPRLRRRGFLTCFFA